MTTEMPRHGGDLAHATASYGTPAGGWLDLSTGINPAPYPAQIDLRSLSPLPGRDAHDALIETARTAYAVPDRAALIAVPGSEIAIRLLPLVVPSGPVAILAPTYGSHREAWAAQRREVVEINALDARPAAASVVVLANPNNPDGRTIRRDDLSDLAVSLAADGGILVVDEAFADLDPGLGLAPLLDRIPAVVLRSFGKFFGLAGLRLGFVAGPPPVVAPLARLLGDWPVSGVALALGRNALANREWQRATRARLAHDAGRLRFLLSCHGLAIAGGTDLFVLVEHRAAAAIHDRLAKAGIWTRAFAGRPTWLRIGIPAGDPDFTRLDDALAAA